MYHVFKSYKLIALGCYWICKQVCKNFDHVHRRWILVQCVASEFKPATSHIQLEKQSSILALEEILAVLDLTKNLYSTPSPYAVLNGLWIIFFMLVMCCVWLPLQGGCLFGHRKCWGGYTGTRRRWLGKEEGPSCFLTHFNFRSVLIFMIKHV